MTSARDQTAVFHEAEVISVTPCRQLFTDFLLKRDFYLKVNGHFSNYTLQIIVGSTCHNTISDALVAVLLLRVDMWSC